MDGSHDPPDGSRYESVRALVDTRASGGVHDPLEVLRRLCSATVGRTSVTGAAINLMSSDALTGVAAASDAVSLSRAELQLVAGEGPCHDAFVESRPVLVPDLARTLGRWPGYASVALESGVCAVYAFPLGVGAASLGVLELFCDKPGSLDDEQVADALTFAQLATDLLVQGRVTTPDGELAPELASAMDVRAEIHQAQGMLMIALDLTVLEALVLMRSYAFSHGRSLISVARDVLRGDSLDDRDT